MTPEELRKRQAPFKERYREDPKAAVITMRATGTLDRAAVVCTVETARETARARVAAGLHEAAGGDGLTACSGDMLMEALAACAGVTLRAVATALEIPVTGGTVTAEGDLDFRGTLAVDREAPVGFRDIRLRFDLQTDASPERLDSLLKLTERYCVVYQTLKNAPPIKLSHRVR
ncbi:MAG: OsmC family protein [Kiloniellaceae bacterium]